MTVMKRYGSTIFDRSNLTLLDVKDLTDPLPIIYEPSDLFNVYQKIFTVNLNSPGWDTSTPFSLLLSVSTFLLTSASQQIQSLGSLREIRLQEFLATPIVIYNDAWLGRAVSDSDMGKSLALAIPSYRVLDPRSNC